MICLNCDKFYYQQIYSDSMKTKFVRFNKLPKIEGQGEGEMETSPTKLVHKESLSNTGSGFKKAESQKYNQLLELFDGLMKKSIKQVRDFQLQSRDRSVVVDLPESEIEGELDDDVLREWMTDVCSQVFSSAFHSLSKDSMSYEHTKIFCSEGILRNIVLLTKKYRLTERQMRIIDDHIEERIVPYMQKKYPLTESNDVSKAIDESVRPIDNRQAIENDLLQKCDVVFTYREDGNYNDLIMRFLNWLMTSVDEKGLDGSKTVYEEYYNFISKLFENVYNEGWMNATSNDSFKNLTEIEKQEHIQKEIDKSNDASMEKYAAQVQQYTHYAIGRKISKNVPMFKEDEISSGHLTIKSPAILRILTKWCDELWDKFTKKNYFLDREENVRVQEKGGNVNTMFMWMKMPLNDLIEEEKKKIEDFMKEVEDNNYDQQARLLIRELERDGFTHIERIEKACGKFAFKTVNNLHCYIVLYLNRIIHGLLTVSKELYETKLSSKARWTSPPDLLSFKIGDIMRCKCSSKEREILKIFQELESISQAKPKLMKIIRVKNRLKLGTNDILINVLFQDRYLCQIQLAVKSTTSKFIKCSNMFSHYVYELGRTLFGPLTELSSVWMSLDPRAVEYLYIIKNQTALSVTEPMGCKKYNSQHNYAELNRPFICSDCNIAYSHTNYLWIHQKCLNPDCGHMICGRCRIQNERPEVLKEKLLKDQPIKVREACTQIVNRKRESERNVPTYGVCIQIESKKIKIQRFKKLEIKKIDSVYGIKQDKNGEEKATLIEELIKKDAEKKFLRKYLVFEIPEEIGKDIVNISIDKAKKDYIIPQKVKGIYKKQKEILSLIDENLDDESCVIMKGPKSGMDQVKNIELADNKLTTLKFITTNYPNLERLQLSRNILQNIDTVSKLKGMTKLNIRDNKLTALPDQLCDLVKLEGLNIRNNQIKALPKNFGNLKEMKKLQSDNNLLTELPESFSNLTKITFIDVSKNKLTKFPDSIKNFKKLKELALSKQELGSAPQWLDSFTQMISLDLGKTKLTNLPAGIFKLKNLITLKFQSSVSQLPAEIGSLLKLQNLCIQMPNLISLPNEMSSLNNLDILELEDCKLDELPDWMSELKRLTTFSLINNKLDRLSLEITEMIRLRYLKIDGQNIKELPDAMKNLKELRTLSLCNNKFTRIPQIVRTYTKLYSLMIKSNEIDQIDEDFFDDLPDIQTLALDSNKLTHFPRSIENLKKIKKLTYKSNSFKDIPQWVDMLTGTIEVVLGLNDSKLKKLDSVFGASNIKS